MKFEDLTDATGRRVSWTPYAGGDRKEGTVTGTTLSGWPTVLLDDGATVTVPVERTEFVGSTAEATRDARDVHEIAAMSAALGMSFGEGCYCNVAGTMAPCGFCTGPHHDDCVWCDTGCSCFGYDVCACGNTGVRYDGDTRICKSCGFSWTPPASVPYDEDARPTPPRKPCATGWTAPSS